MPTGTATPLAAGGLNSLLISALCCRLRRCWASHSCCAASLLLAGRRLCHRFAGIRKHAATMQITPPFPSVPEPVRRKRSIIAPVLARRSTSDSINTRTVSCSEKRYAAIGQVRISLKIKSTNSRFLTMALSEELRAACSNCGNALPMRWPILLPTLPDAKSRFSGQNLPCKWP